MAPINHLPTRRLAEAFLQANPTPAPATLRAFVANHPRPLPPLPAPQLNPKLARLMGCLLLAVLLLVAGTATALFFFGERPESVRPALTARERVNAFRI